MALDEGCDKTMMKFVEQNACLFHYYAGK